jgi:hypothetical protein
MDEEGINRLTEDLRTESLPEVILDRLKVLKLALKDESEGDKTVRWFLRAGGLPTIIRLLRGTATSDTRTAMDSHHVSQQK